MRVFCSHDRNELYGSFVSLLGKGASGDGAGVVIRLPERDGFLRTTVQKRDMSVRAVSCGDWSANWSSVVSRFRS